MTHPLIHLERRLLARYHLKENTVVCGEKILRVLSVANIDELLDQVTDENEIPFWAELWPAAIGLLQFLIAWPQLKGQTVLELGCGTGLAGLGVLLRGGVLTQTDYMVEALQFAAVNAARNGLSPAQCVQADWRHFSLRQKYDWIIGSDVLYEKKLHPFLWQIFHSNLSAEGQVVLADPGRLYAQQFMQIVEEHGWTVQTDRRLIDFEAKITPVDIYCCRPPKVAGQGPSQQAFYGNGRDRIG